MSLVPHLLQSTLFAAAVWLATLALRHNHARSRHALWMAASVKFLVPFSVLVALGGRLAPPAASPVPPPQMRFVMVESAPPGPAGEVAAVLPAAPVGRDWRPRMLWLLWACGCAGILIRWYLRWQSAAAILHGSAVCGLPGLAPPIPVRRSPAMLEPGIFGIVHPVLVLPAGIEERLSAGQLRAILAHELCHVRHRDNLAAAIHMLVEALFWFHPLVWWLGARLVDERERACDEEVLQLGSDRTVYAESILRICQLCLESPVPCVCGITGADLKQRIRHIMTAGVRRNLEPSKKLLLTALGIAAIAVPLAMGLAHPPQIRAQAPQTAAPMQFKAASLKLPANQDILETRPHRSIGRFRWKTQLIYLLGYAYNMEWWRISEPPGTDKIYEVEATTEPHTSESDVRLMLQTLLLERFKMKVHRVIRDGVDGYVLAAVQKSPKLEDVKEAEPSDDPATADGWVSAGLPKATEGELTAKSGSMLQLTDMLQRLLSTSVLDQTGLKGKYNFQIRYTRSEGADNSDVIPAVKQLGLKLERYKGPVEFLVIDHMDNLVEN